MKWFIVLCFCTLVFGNSKLPEENKRKEKLFSLFSIVTFPNDQCTSKSDSTMYGICKTQAECSDDGGTADGNCAAGFGVCCVITKSSCSGSVTQNCTYITNPSYPTTYTTTGTCSYSVTPCSSDICQIRLDFDNFDITETTAGVCTDSFSITGNSGLNPEDLCGTLTGQHIYFENARSTTAATLSFTIATGGTWKIKVTQLECSSLSRAPTDCDQYATGRSGQVESYNYPNRQLQSKDYSICIRREEGYCGIQYTQALPVTSPDTFSLDDTSTTLNLNGANTAGPGDAYLTIPNGRYQTVYSGNALADSTGNTMSTPSAVFQDGHNFILRHTVAANSQSSNLGFRLDYTQIPCIASTYSVT